MAKTNAEIQAASDARKRANGWFQKKYWCTRDEHNHLKKCLDVYREKDGVMIRDETKQLR